ncbi:MAG: HAMP domain-containing histidine kinase [Acidimicrobiales bacterium]|nr:HAMP domain-containing histidine kinase [Acidimicrobiales bacterium]
MKPWTEVIAEYPLRAVVAALVVLVLTAASGLALRAITRRTRSLHHLVLAITLTSLGVGAVATLALGQLMVLEPAERDIALGVIAVTAVLSVVVALVASVPLARDARSVEATVRRIEAGDRVVRTGVVRADELGHVARALDDLTARLDALERERASADAERRLMLSSISHDLRTPLAALRAAVEALSDGVAPDPQRYLRSMLHDVEALGLLIEDLFLLTSLEAGRYDLTLERIDVAEIADTAVEALTPIAERHGVTLTADLTGASPIDGSAQAIGRVLRNLIENAVRHAPPGTTVTVHVSTEPDGPVVRVVDEGPGFAAAFAPQAFDAFTRADGSRTRATGGAGLGLAIARGLVDAHGGRIWIEAPRSERPGGEVVFTIPAKA